MDLTIGLARRAGANLRLIHALDFGAALPCDPGDPEYWRGCAETDADRYLEGIAEQIRSKSDLPVSFSVRHGLDAVATILGEAQDWEADLIVMTTHGRSGLKRTILGSAADQIIRGAELPVLVLRPGA